MYERILVVDDEPDTADTLSKLITMFGYEAKAVYEGIAAVEQAALLAPEMALIDIEMPDLDGYEIAERIRRQPEGTRMILVAVTGWTRLEDKRRAYDSGFDLHVAKPVDLDTLKDVLSILDPVACIEPVG